MVIDLRSDTVTTPTDNMFKAMRSATLEDDSLQGDTTVAKLEQRATELTGKPHALFISSGTMGNLIAALAHNQRGGTEAVVDAQSHTALSEAGGISRIAGLFCVPVASVRGEMDLNQLADSLRKQYSRSGGATSFVAVETSHNNSGGCVPSLNYLAEVKQLATEREIPVHMDGARVCNAAVKLQVPLKTICAYADSVTLCLSKGLSAPMGSVIVGSEAFIQRAKTFRKMLGGGLRQSGIMAAAGLVALNEGITRLEEDHRVAFGIWQGLRNLDCELVSSEPPDTNMVQILTNASRISDRQWLLELQQRNLACRIQKSGVLRLVTHRHINEDLIPAIVSAFATIITATGRAQ